MPAGPTNFHRVTLPWACFGIISKEGIVVSAAPVAKWAIGKPVGKVIAYYLNRGARAEELP